MADAPQTVDVKKVNQPAMIVDAILRGVFSVFLPVAYAAEVSACPVLGVPPLSWVFKWVQDWIGNELRKRLSEESTFLIIEFETYEEKKNFKNAITLLKAAIAKGNLNDPDLLQKVADLDQAFDKLVHYDGSFSP